MSFRTLPALQHPCMLGEEGAACHALGRPLVAVLPKTSKPNPPCKIRLKWELVARPGRSSAAVRKLKTVEKKKVALTAAATRTASMLTSGTQ